MLVLKAPLVTEDEGKMIQKSGTFWSVYRFNSELFIETVFPLSGNLKRAVLKFSLIEKIWDLWVDSPDDAVDPLEYPLDSLIIYYLTVINGDIMIHASGVEYNEKGYIFSGISGKGKTTMAGIWNRAGGRIIHDDRLIIRKSGNNYFMFNTPVYANDSPSLSPVTGIFLIDHGPENTLVPVSGARAISLVLANCIQHNWNRDIVVRLIESVNSLCNAVQVALLTFRPEESIIDFITHHSPGI